MSVTKSTIQRAAQLLPLEVLHMIYDYTCSYEMLTSDLVKFNSKNLYTNQNLIHLEKLTYATLDSLKIRVKGKHYSLKHIVSNISMANLALINAKLAHYMLRENEILYIKWCDDRNKVRTQQHPSMYYLINKRYSSERDDGDVVTFTGDSPNAMKFAMSELLGTRCHENTDHRGVIYSRKHCRIAYTAWYTLSKNIGDFITIRRNTRTNDRKTDTLIDKKLYMFLRQLVSMKCVQRAVSCNGSVWRPKRDRYHVNDLYNKINTCSRNVRVNARMQERRKARENKKLAREQAKADKIQAREQAKADKAHAKLEAREQAKADKIQVREQAKADKIQVREQAKADKARAKLEAREQAKADKARAREQAKADKARAKLEAREQAKADKANRLVA